MYIIMPDYMSPQIFLYVPYLYTSLEDPVLMYTGNRLRKIVNCYPPLVMLHLLADKVKYL